ncbi:hypothetical protein RHSIM_Rhsim01G0054600 [Rhododendron simsii]|uniref:Uncharacterized protein n=1 Tax=Rhododendron simsii TaxID=118357 RepID=A0A834HM27_RHOSS|nr:hypothetical protein RHSIM_Rhsim01G0054600 [Rhododendron simsii]
MTPPPSPTPNQQDPSSEESSSERPHRMRNLQEIYEDYLSFSLILSPIFPPIFLTTKKRVVKVKLINDLPCGGQHKKNKLNLNSEINFPGLYPFVSLAGIGIVVDLSNLKELDLSYNILDNSILPSLNDLPNLKILNLSRNALNGSISAKEFGSLNNLKELDLRSNEVVSIITVNGMEQKD